MKTAASSRIGRHIHRAVAAACPSRTAPTLEPLESRRLLSAAPVPAGLSPVGPHLSPSAVTQPNDNSVLPTALGTAAVGSKLGTTGQVGGDTTDDHFRIDVTAPLTLSVKLDKLKQPAGLQLSFLDAAPIRSASGKRSSLLTQRLDPGAYLLDVTSTAGTATNFRLSVIGKKPPKKSVAPVDPTTTPVGSPPMMIGVGWLPGGYGFNAPNAIKPVGLSPQEVRHAYGIDVAGFNGQALDGAGQTIAIIDAFDDPNVAQDLITFDRQFNLPDPVFQKLAQDGSQTLPKPNKGWAGEIALDVEWAHAVAPGAKILLVEAKNNAFPNLLAAGQFAASLPDVSVVSMSFGGPEQPTDPQTDSVFLTPAGHQGITFVQATGDNGAPGEFVSPNVVGVGGTTLNLDASGNYAGEAAWSGSGGGLLQTEPQPAYQQGVVTQSTTRRGTPDVAFEADPATGVAVVDSFNNSAASPWNPFPVGGTSLSAPAFAGIVALADQRRVLAGLSTLDGATQTLPNLYRLQPDSLHDITTGSNGNPAGPGYDLATGLGSPMAGPLVAALSGVADTSGSPIQPTPPTEPGQPPPGGPSLSADLGPSAMHFSDGSVGDQYTFTAASAGPASVTATSAAFGPAVAVAQVNADGSKSLVGVEWNLGLNSTAVASFPAQQGTQYLVLVGSLAGKTGAYGLQFSGNLGGVQQVTG